MENFVQQTCLYPTQQSNSPEFQDFQFPSHGKQAI
jgi:hypothetical protein